MKGETVARVTLWLLWSLWTLACIVLVLGALANYLASRTQTLPLVLQPGATAEITVYRFIDDPLRLRLRYADDGADPAVDPELRLPAETHRSHRVPCGQPLGGDRSGDPPRTGIGRARPVRRLVLRLRPQ